MAGDTPIKRRPNPRGVTPNSRLLLGGEDDDESVYDDDSDCYPSTPGGPAAEITTGFTPAPPKRTLTRHWENELLSTPSGNHALATPASDKSDLVELSVTPARHVSVGSRRRSVARQRRSATQADSPSDMAPASSPSIEPPPRQVSSFREQMLRRVSGMR